MGDIMRVKTQAKSRFATMRVCFLLRCAGAGGGEEGGGDHRHDQAAHSFLLAVAAAIRRRPWPSSPGGDCHTHPARERTPHLWFFPMACCISDGQMRASAQLRRHSRQADATACQCDAGSPALVCGVEQVLSADFNFRPVGQIIQSMFSLMDKQR